MHGRIEGGATEAKRQAKVMAAGSYQLVVCSGDETETHAFDQDCVVIGRASASDVVLNDRRVSRRHCRVERRDDTFVLVDEGSQNRVKLRGQPVDCCELRPGDVFSVGRFDVTFDVLESDQGSLDDTAIGEEVRSVEDLGAFVAIARALNEERDLTRLLTLIVDSAIQLTNAERGFLLLGKAEEATVEVARNFAREEVLAPEFKISRTIAQRVRETGEAEVTTNAQEDDRFRDLRSVGDLRLRSVLCIPLRVRGEVSGVVYVDNRLQQQAFGEREKSLLVSLADHAAIAVHNARTVADLRERRIEVQEAHDRVAQLNAALKGRLAAQKAELSEMREELQAPRSDGGFRHDYSSIVGDSRRMREVFTVLDKYIDAGDPVLILGESGTGKELVARAIHEQGSRKGGPFVVENVAALPEALLESELFGHAKGAFTGAASSKKGRLELASGGVLFLDEIGEMPLDLQAKLLRVIEEGRVRPIGAHDPVDIDVRLITATNRNLDEMVRDGDFRGDLYYRLNVLPVQLPPLRERRDDIPELVRCFTMDIETDDGVRLRVSPDAMDALVAYSWPGNVRELQNELRRAAVLCDGVILLDQLGERIRDPQQGALDGGAVPAEAGTTLPDMVQALEVREITKAYQLAGGNKSRAAEMLGLSRFALQRKLEKYGIGGADEGTPGDGE